jgi:hypothetical protein
MGRFKTPQRKKKESYAHDRMEGGEYPHADRRNRPQVKAQGNRQLRRRANQLLAAEPGEIVQLPRRMNRDWLKSSQRLPDYLERTKINHITREANNIFRRGYSYATHTRFRRVLKTWMNGDTQYSSALADYYHGLLNGFPQELHAASILADKWSWGGYLRLSERRRFLKRFFSVEPDLKHQFQNWIESLRTKSP